MKCIVPVKVSLSRINQTSLSLTIHPRALVTLQSMVLLSSVQSICPIIQIQTALPWTWRSQGKDAPEMYLKLHTCIMFLCRKSKAFIASMVLVTILALMLISSDSDHFLINNPGHYLTEVLVNIYFKTQLAGSRTLFSSQWLPWQLLMLSPPSSWLCNYLHGISHRTYRIRWLVKSP